MKIKFIILLIASVFVFVSCEKDIDVELETPEDKIVFEGAIETGEYPYVIITKNQAYFATVDTNTLMDMMVTDAIVTVSDGSITDTLKLRPYFYTIPPYRYVGSKIKGEEGKTYKMKAIVNGETYEAETTIPAIVPIDSIKFKYNTPEDTFGVLWAYWQDPPGLGNFYRIFTRTLGKDSVFVHRRFSLLEDQIIDNQPIEFAIVRGKDPAVPEEEYEDLEPPYWSFVPGETVYVKLASMDAVSFEFWKLIEQQNASNGNPFAAPTTLKTNISNNALGIWAGYAVDIDTVHITPDIILPAE